MRLHASGADGDDIGAELGEFRYDEAVQAFADGGQQDDGGNADGDAEGSQHRAQPLRPERRVGEVDEIGVTHDYRLDSACTGSSMAARLAGATVNSTAVTSAIAGAATRAHHGAWNGISG